MHRHRRLLVVAGAAVLVARPLRAFAQRDPRLIAWLSPSSREAHKGFLDTFRSKLQELGHIEGRDFVIEGRWAEGRLEKLPELAAQLLERKPVVILTAGTTAVKVLKEKTTSVPVVFASSADVTALGLVQSLARPGGNITGVTLNEEMYGKLLDIVREIIPTTARIAMLGHETDAVNQFIVDVFLRYASLRKLKVEVVNIKKADELEQAMKRIAASKPDALFVPLFSLFVTMRSRISELALTHRLALIVSSREQALAGALFSYGSNLKENYWRSAVLVHKILNGANPSELPVELPTRFELILNMKIAKALGVAVPPATLARAEELIQ